MLLQKMEILEDGLEVGEKAVLLHLFVAVSTNGGVLHVQASLVQVNCGVHHVQASLVQGKMPPSRRQ